MVELHHYHLFGLRLQSELVLPELHRNRHAVEPDVRIELGPPADVGGLQNEFSTTDDGACLSIADIGRYSISSSRILVEPASGAHLRNVRLYLLGSAMGILLHQRGLLPLHANAIEIDGRAFALHRTIRAGKSTLAAVFMTGVSGSSPTMSAFSASIRPAEPMPARASRACACGRKLCPRPAGSPPPMNYPMPELKTGGSSTFRRS